MCQKASDCGMTIPVRTAVWTIETPQNCTVCCWNTIQPWPSPFRLPLWFTQRYFKGPLICLCPRIQEIGACMACKFSQKHFYLGKRRRLFTTSPSVLKSREGGLCIKMMLLHISYCYCINFEWTNFQSGCLSPADSPKNEMLQRIEPFMKPVKQSHCNRNISYIVWHDKCRSEACKTAGNRVPCLACISECVCTSGNTSWSTVTSGFRRDVDEICALLGYYAASRNIPEERRSQVAFIVRS
jgi:hypothetical protein